MQRAAEFRLHEIITSADDDRVTTLPVDDEGNRSPDVFELEDGLIRREWEHLPRPGEDWTGRGILDQADGGTG